MKKIILLIILLTLSRKITSQTASEQPPKEHSISIGLIGSPDYCYRSLSSTSQYQWLVNERNSLEIPKYSYTYGVSFQWQMAKRFAVELDAQVSDKGYKTKNYSLIWPSQGNSTNLPTSISHNYHYKYTDGTLKGNIFLLTNAFKLYITIGGVINVLDPSTDKYTETYPDGHTETNSEPLDLTGVSKATITVISGLGASYDIGKHFIIKLEPVYRRALTSLSSGNVHEILYSYGINAGVYYKF
jgi:hypothetical protein